MVPNEAAIPSNTAQHNFEIFIVVLIQKMDSIAFMLGLGKLLDRIRIDADAERRRINRDIHRRRLRRGGDEEKSAASNNAGVFKADILIADCMVLYLQLRK